MTAGLTTATGIGVRTVHKLVEEPAKGARIATTVALAFNRCSIRTLSYTPKCGPSFLPDVTINSPAPARETGCESSKGDAVIKRVAAVVFATACLMAVGPERAMAVDFPSSCTAIASVTGAKTCWQATGEKLYVKDTASDGRRAGGLFQVWWAEGGSSLLKCENTNGNGTTVLCDFSFPENLQVLLFAGTCDGGSTSCDDDSSWRVGTEHWTHT